MRPIRLSVASAPIPFRSAFGHAAATRRQAENILVRVEDAEGRVGLGEGCPREYVTGETPASAHAFLKRHAATLLALNSVDSLRGWLVVNEAEVDANPSAFCAAELALLDLFARQADIPIERFLALPDGAAPLTVSAVYGSGGWWKFRAQTLLFSRARMRDSKLKLSGRSAEDVRRAALLARAGRVRLDGNNLWPDAASAIEPLRALQPHVWAVEEPIGARDWAGLAQVHAATGLQIIADESFARLADLDAMPKAGFVPNFRISKLGGLLRATAALEKAREQGREIVVGAQVGETSILARAGAALASAAGSILRGLEIGYGRHLLRWDVARPEVRFGSGGVLDVRAFAKRPGLGLTLSKRPLDWETLGPETKTPR